MKPTLSILIPTVPSRSHELSQLIGHLTAIGADDPAVEVLAFSDNRRRSIGAKRQALLDMARGEYVAFCDDDDWLADPYFSEILPRCESGPDVVTFEQIATINGVEGRIVFDATCRVDEPWKPNGVARRRPWHVCAWKRSLAQRGLFTEINYGEDAAWVAQVAHLARTTLHVPRVLHYYRHDAKTTLAPA
jgi:glycosyltransferase involved in cell wall biosynthesis